MTGRTTPQLSTARKALIDKGLIEATGQGRLRFTMPGFAEFVRDQVDVPWYGAKLQAGTLHTEQLPETPRQPPGRPIRELPPGGQGQPGTDPAH